MIRKVLLTCCIAALASSSLTNAQVVGKPAPNRVAPSTAQSRPRVALTPKERLFLPLVQKKFSAQAASRLPHAATDLLAGASSAVPPNFGGYLTAPFYPAHLETACITEPSNCGVNVLLTADFNKDGKQDVAVIQYDGTLNVLLNNGSGGFAAPVAYINPNNMSSFIVQGFAVDVNNDGYADIVALDLANNAVIVYLNQKNGTFGPAQTLDFTYNYGSINCIAVGDINGDGIPDVVTAATNVTSPTSTEVTLQSYLGTGTGSFVAPGASLTQTVVIPDQVELQAPGGIALGDLNKDGTLDLALQFLELGSLSETGPMTSTTASSGDQIVVSVALGNGDGTFGAMDVNNPVTIPVIPEGPFVSFATAGVQIADLNNDSNPDLAVDNNGTLYVALGNGSGGFTSVVQTANIPGASQIVYADVNGDGVPDMVQTGDLMDVWIGNGDGTFSLPVNGSGDVPLSRPVNGNSYMLDPGGPQSLTVADYTGDGNVDIAQLGGAFKQLSVFAGDGNGAFHGAPVLDTTTDSPPNPTNTDLESFGDIKGNGYTDLLYVDMSGAANYLVAGISDGKGNFTYTTALSAAAAPTLDYIQPVTADFNGDGKVDLLFAGYDNSLSVALSNGDGTFQAPVALALPTLDCVLSYAATGDLNGDGHTDIVVTYPGDNSCGGSDGTPSGYFVALGNGDGTFATPVFTAYGAELYSATLADMHMNGNLDLILDDAPFDGAGNFAVYLLPGNGDGTFGAGSTVVSSIQVADVIAGDYNQDGKPDLILLSEGAWDPIGDNLVDNTESIMLFPGNGDGTFGEANQLATGTFFLSGVLQDMNGDGIPDLVVGEWNSSQPNTYYGLSTLLGQGNGVFSSPVNALDGSGVTMVAPGNFFADNVPDIAVATSNGTALFLGQGGTTIGLASSASSLAFGQAETLTATVAATMPGRPAPTGTVSFYDGTSLLGSSVLSGGTASFSTAALAPGSHGITAVYGGDNNFNFNTSSANTINVSALPPGFSLSASSSSLSLSQGQNGIVTLTLNANAIFSGVVNLTCSGAPSNATCTLNPTSVSLAPGGAGTATLVIGTTAASAAKRAPSSPWHGPAGALSLAALLWAFSGRRKFGRALFGLTLTGLVFSTSVLSGCGSNSVPTASNGRYTVTVTATPSNSIAPAQTTKLSVSIQ
jgi:Bacterial Ig-like domain (group 3)/FG-GAP-like repeat